MSDSIQLYGQITQAYFVPSASDVQIVVNVHNKRGWSEKAMKDCVGTLLKLLSAGFCLLFFIGCQSAPKFEVEAITPAVFEVSVAAVQAKQDDTLTAVKENTAAIEKIVTKINSLEGAIANTQKALEAAQISQSQPREEVIQSEDTSPPKNANDSHPVTPAVAEGGDVPLFVTVTRFCLPCNQLKRDYLKGKFEGFDVTFCVATASLRDELIREGIPANKVIIDETDVGLVPAIRVPWKDSETGWIWHQPRGYGRDTLAELRAALLGKSTPQEWPQTSTKPFVFESQNTNPVVSHGDLVSIHNQLHGGGQWTWPGDLATHLQQVHGVQIDGTAANYKTNPVVSSRSIISASSRRQTVNWRGRSVLRQSCPGGNCP